MLRYRIRIAAGITAILLSVPALIAGAALTAPCRTEDSLMCSWNAAVQGNGHGRSYTAFTDDFIIYWD